MDGHEPPLTTLWTRVEVLRVRDILFMKANDLAMLPLDRSGAPTSIYKFLSRDVRNSALAVAPRARRVVFADGNRLFVADEYGDCRPLHGSPSLGDLISELNWELVADDNLDTIWVTDMGRDQAGRQLRVVRFDLRQHHQVTEQHIGYPDSGAYQVGASTGTVAWLRTNENRVQELVVSSPRGRRHLPLVHRYNWLRMAPNSDTLLLSGAVRVGPLAIVPLEGELSEHVLPFFGHTASWAGDDHVLSHSATGCLEMVAINGTNMELLIGVASPYVQPPTSFVPATVNAHGTVVAWSWTASRPSGAKLGGTVLLDLVAKEYRVLDSSWFRVSLLS